MSKDNKIYYIYYSKEDLKWTKVRRDAELIRKLKK